VGTSSKESQAQTNPTLGEPWRPSYPSIWKSIPPTERRFILLAISLAFVQLFVVDVYFRIQELSAINQYLGGQTQSIAIPDGIQYWPFVLSGLVYALLVAASVILVNSSIKSTESIGLSWLGSAWLLASIPLVLDLLIDTFEVKWPIIILFVFAGFRYWKGIKNNSVSFVLAPAVTAIAAADGLGHLGGQFCPATGLDSCSAKAVSDLYLVAMLLFLTYLTLKGRDKRPGWLLIAAAVAIPIAILASVTLGDLF
jgi:hypothetical protein